MQALRAFHDMIEADSARAVFGPAHVIAANEQEAIHTLVRAAGTIRVYRLRSSPASQWLQRRSLLPNIL